MLPVPLFARRTRAVAVLEWSLVLLPLGFFLVGLIVPK
jgi:hypothetical protein